MHSYHIETPNQNPLHPTKRQKWRNSGRQRDERAINAQVDKVEKVAAGKRPIARDRFVTVTADQDGKKADVNWTVIERARFSAGFKGFVTNIPAETLDGPVVVAAYQDLWRVEESFRMSKHDLQARPIFHRKKDAIDAHLTVVFTALAVARYLQDRTDVSIKRLIKTLRPLRTVTISIDGQPITAQPRLGPDAAAILDKIPDVAGHQKRPRLCNSGFAGGGLAEVIQKRTDDVHRQREDHSRVLVGAQL